MSEALIELAEALERDVLRIAFQRGRCVGSRGHEPLRGASSGGGSVRERNLPFLLAGHMLELLDGPTGLKWLEIVERNHPGLFEIEELRNALNNPPKL